MPPGSWKAASIRSAADATAMPAAPPIVAEHEALDDELSRDAKRGPPPIASRTPISRRLAAARDSSRFARLAHPISKRQRDDAQQQRDEARDIRVVRVPRRRVRAPATTST